MIDLFSLNPHTMLLFFNKYMDLSSYDFYKPSYKCILDFVLDDSYIKQNESSIKNHYRFISEFDIRYLLNMRGFNISGIEDILSYLHEYKFCYIDLQKKSVSRLEYKFYIKLSKLL